MRRILKFSVGASITTVVTADIPQWLSVGWQDDALVAWCVAEAGEGVTSYLAALPTGSTVPDNATYVGTAQHPTLNGGGPLVIHVYAKEW